MNKIPANCIVTGSRRCNVAPGKESECIMSFPHKRNLLLMPLPDGIGEHIHKISGLISNPQIYVILFHYGSHPAEQVSWDSRNNP